jgi:hypothetical protein
VSALRVMNSAVEAPQHFAPVGGGDGASGNYSGAARGNLETHWPLDDCGRITGNSEVIPLKPRSAEF